MKRAWSIGVVAALLVVFGGYFGWRLLRAKPAPSFDTAVVSHGKIVAKATASGTLSALVTVQVGSQVSGRLAEINVDFNSPVQKGEVLAKLDPALFEASVEQAKANLVAAEGTLEKSKAQAADAQRVLARQTALRDQKLIAQADLDTAQANADAAAAQVKASRGGVEQARATLHQAETNLAYTTIVSPISGTVISRSVDVGQTVAATLSAPTLFTIAENLQKMQVDTSVAEADVGKLQPGMAASFFVDAYPTRRFDGTVRQIRNAAQTVQNVVTYDAVIDVENPDLALKPGMTATVTFVYAEKDNVLQVPNAALRFHPPASLVAKAEKKEGKKEAKKEKKALAENEPRTKMRLDAGSAASAVAAQPDPATRAPDERDVWVLDGKHPRMVTIRVGVSDGTQTEVIDGDLKDGDSVVVGMSSGGGASNAGGGKKPGFKRMF